MRNLAAALVAVAPANPAAAAMGVNLKNAALGLCNDDATTIRNKGM